MKAAIKRYGEAFMVGGSERRGIVATLSPNRARTYLSDLAVDGALRPIRSVYVAFDDPTLEGDSVTWLGEVYAVARAVALRHRGETVARLLVLVAS
jgi:hypothetical protein